jgi:hypothetical protein
MGLPRLVLALNGFGNEADRHVAATKKGDGRVRWE